MARESETIQCRSCGAWLAVQLDAAEVRCDHCGVATTIPLEIRRRVAAHAEAVAAAQAQTHRHGEQAHRLRIAAVHNTPFTISIILLGCAVPWWIIASATEVTATMGPAAWGLALVVTISPLVVVLSALRRWWARTRRIIDAARITGRCGACGGPLEFVEGKALLRCAQCRSTTVATREQTEALERAASRRLASAEDATAAAHQVNARSLDLFNRVLAWLTDGPLGFAAFFGAAVLVAGCVLSLAIAPASSPRTARAGWICLAVCAGLAALALLWGVVGLVQRLAWARLLAAARPRWRPRWALVRDAIGFKVQLAACLFAGFGAIAAALWNPRAPKSVEAATIMGGFGTGLAILTLAVAAVRVLMAIAGARLGQDTPEGG